MKSIALPVFEIKQGNIALAPLGFDKCGFQAAQVLPGVEVSFAAGRHASQALGQFFGFQVINHGGIEVLRFAHEDVPQQRAVLASAQAQCFAGRDVFPSRINGVAQQRILHGGAFAGDGGGQRQASSDSGTRSLPVMRWWRAELNNAESACCRSTS